MKAIVLTKYGSSENLSLQEVEHPTITDAGVLIKIQGTSVNSGDWHLMRGSPVIARLIYGLFKPKVKILGFDIAGRVEAVGKAVTQFKPGDEVFGDLSECGFGAFAEYVCAPESALVHKPINLSFEEAATVPGAALTALQGLREIGQIQPGQRVLINGASGGVGSFAVQIAKILGAEVTAVCSTKKIEKVRSLGADHVLDYTQTDITQVRQQYDLMLDAAAFRSVFDYLPGLVPQGTYVMVGGSTVWLFQVLLFGTLISKIRNRKVKGLIVKPNQADLLTLKAWIEAGKLKPLIDQCYSLSEVPTAIRYVEQRQVTGKVAIRV